MNILIPAIFLTINGFRIKDTQNKLQIKIWNFRKSILAKIFYAFNCFMLFANLTLMNNSDTEFEQRIYKIIKPKSTVYILNDSPYAPWGKDNPQHDFYKPGDVDFVFVESLDSINASDEPLVILHDKYMDALNDFNSTEILHYKSKNIYLVLKEYIKKDKRESWGLYKVKAKRNGL
ncbi:hypothetical protein AGMMS49546_08560 [Spirochaetia bacterium]|nr:hypothetical protein AGMMS49546_08560 [Spirochaetia bacterium]